MDENELTTTTRRWVRLPRQIRDRASMPDLPETTRRLMLSWAEIVDEMLVAMESNADSVTP